MAEPEHPLMELTPSEAAALEGARAEAVDELLAPEAPHANVVGIAAGVKWRNGEPTGEPAVLALVTHKMDESDLPEEDLVPESIGGTPTDVLEIGFPTIERQQLQVPTTLNGAVAEEQQLVAQVPVADAQMLAKRLRPAEGGYSVGHFKITAGTIATCVYDLLPGSTTGGKPKHGTGMPPRY